MLLCVWRACAPIIADVGLVPIEALRWVAQPTAWSVLPEVMRYQQVNGRLHVLSTVVARHSRPDFPEQLVRIIRRERAVVASTGDGEEIQGMSEEGGTGHISQSLVPPGIAAQVAASTH